MTEFTFSSLGIYPNKGMAHQQWRTTGVTRDPAMHPTSMNKRTFISLHARNAIYLFALKFHALFIPVSRAR
jgi:hypothetical protein